MNADPSYGLREGGKLADIIPTLIELMGMEQPKEMTDESQVELYQIIISVASGESDDKKLLEWLLNHETMIFNNSIAKSSCFLLNKWINIFSSE